MSASARLARQLAIGLADPAASQELLSLVGITTFGTVYYVDFDNGNDNNDGLSTDQAKKTVLAAYNLMTSNAHDWMLLSGNSAHSFATQLATAKNRCHFLGLGGAGRYSGQRTRWEMGVTTGSEVALLLNTGNGNSFHNIKMRSVDTNTSSLYTFADGGEHTHLQNVALEKDALLSTALCHELLANGDTAFYERCTIGNLIYQTAHATRCPVSFKRETITGKVARDVLFEKCKVLVKAGLTTSVHFEIPGATDIERYLEFDDCRFISAKLGANTQARVFNIGAAQTEGEIYLTGGTCSFNVSEVADTGEGVFTDHPSAVKDGPEGIGVAVT